MKLWSLIPIFSAACFLCLLSGCTTVTNIGPANTTESVDITPQVTSLAAGSTTTFTATASGSTLTPGFSVAYADLADVGTITSSGSGTAVYKAPAKPPIYPGVFPPASQQGTVVLQAGIPSNAFSPVGASETITITAPSVTAGISPASIAVPLGGTAQFSGYAVGNVNNTVTWQVAGVSGGNPADGTITATGLYTAPAAIPMAGANVTIAAVSVADPTKAATAVVTLH